jgi:hypothetical protein
MGTSISLTPFRSSAIATVSSKLRESVIAQRQDNQGIMQLIVRIANPVFCAAKLTAEKDYPFESLP